MLGHQLVYFKLTKGGMNAATRVATRLCLNRGHIPIGINHGFSGLVNDDVFVLNWAFVSGWQTG